jgi:hypothetical protein
MSEESGRPEVYIEPFPGTGERWQVSARGGADPHWRADGRELFYLGSDGTVVAVDTTHPDWRHPSATPLFHVTVPYIAGAPDISVSPDGQRFVVNVFVSDPIPTPVQVVVNWTALLKRQ